MKLALALVLSLPSTWATAGPTEAPPTTEIYLDLMVQADKATSRGNHREAANLCNLAFRSRPQSHWADTTSIVIIHKAIASYEAAVTELGEDIGQLRTRADLLRAESGLLHDFVVAAHRTQEIPPQIAQAAVVLWPQIDELDARIAAFEEEQARIRRQDEEIRREIINDETEQAPLEKEIRVACSREHAFAVFTSRIDVWWPRGHRRFGESELRLEPFVGGRFFERAANGEEFDLGAVRIWEASEVDLHERGSASHIDASLALRGKQRRVGQGDVVRGVCVAGTGHSQGAVGGECDCL